MKRVAEIALALVVLVAGVLVAAVLVGLWWPFP